MLHGILISKFVEGVPNKATFEKVSLPLNLLAL